MNKQRTGKLVPMTINGLVIMGSLAAVDKGKRTVHHGEFEGVQVNSPATLKIGAETIAIWPEADKSTHFTMSKAALGVTATQFLQAEGYTVTKNS